jgi:hypothetical protein
MAWAPATPSRTYDHVRTIATVCLTQCVYTFIVQMGIYRVSGVGYDLIYFNCQQSLHRCYFINYYHRNISCPQESDWKRNLLENGNICRQVGVMRYR